MIAGWDLGGAHLKAVVLDDAGRVTAAAQVPCPLWLGIGRLEEAIAALPFEPGAVMRHAVTMTGELADLFPDRATGVAQLAGAFARACGRDDFELFAGEEFVPARAASSRWHEVASANWRAAARVLAQRVPDALMIDAGSTTTDIVRIEGGRVATPFDDDAGRLASESLVYAGVVRTPLMALADSVPFRGERVGVMREYFATTGDLFRITGQLAGEFDHADTADSRGRSPEESMRRLARMVGRDAGDAQPREWQRLARWWAGALRDRVLEASARVLSGSDLPVAPVIVGLGVGDFLVAEVARVMQCPFRRFADAMGVSPEWSAAVQVCGPAYAVAELARE